MEFITHFFSVSVNYAKEIWFSLLLGFFLSGLIHQFIPSSLIEKHLGERGFKPILISALIGMVLPICCVGSLPLAVTMQKKGARLGPILAFLVTTPGTSVPALMVCWKLLGGVFTVYIALAVVILGILMGLIGNYLNSDVKTLPLTTTDDDCDLFPSESSGSLSDKLKQALKYSFITLPKSIGPELLLGILIASFILVFAPLQNLIQHYLIGPFGYFVIVVVSLVTYVCETANIPLAHALLKSGMSAGQVMAYLIIGPVTSYGTFLVLKKSFGVKVMWTYMLSLSALSVLFGLLFDFLW